MHNSNVKINSVDHSRTKSVKCAGSLIDRDKVLTVAHCILPEYESILDQVAQTININPNNTSSSQYVELGFAKRSFSNVRYPTMRVFIKKIIIHANYNKTTRDNDIAIIILEKQVDLNSNIRIACLPNITTNEYLGINQSVYQFNMNGLFRQGENFDNELKVVDGSLCDIESSSQLCAGKFQLNF